MTRIRRYTFQVHDGANEAFLKAVRDVVTALTHIEGFAGAELCRSLTPPDEYVFSERWRSPRHYANGSVNLPGALLKVLMTTLTGPPVSTDLDLVDFSQPATPVKTSDSGQASST